MVWLTWPKPSLLSEWAQACGRLPSTELALVRDAVRERARRVMLAEGTVDRGGTGCEGQRARPGASRQEESHKQGSQRGPFFGWHRGPSQPGLWLCCQAHGNAAPAPVSEPGGQGARAHGCQQDPHSSWPDIWPEWGGSCPGTPELV